MAATQKIATEADLFLLIGIVTSTWGNIEIGLEGAFIQSVDPAGIGGGAAARAFWEVASFQGKLHMTDAAVRYATKQLPDLRDRWINLQNRANRESKKRNEIAHGEVVRESTSRGGKQEKTEIVFRPYSFKEIYKRQDDSKYAPKKRTVQDILEFIGKLYALSEDLKLFKYDFCQAQLLLLPEQLERRIDALKFQIDRPTGAPSKDTPPPDEQSPV